MKDEILLLKTAVAEENRENGRKTATAFTLPIENQNGYVFGVLEVESRAPFATALLEVAKDRLSRLATTLQKGASVPRRFEQTLEAINEDIFSKAMEMETFPPEHLNAIIGLAVDNTVYISGSGELAAIFLHKLPEGRYQVFNLARSIHTEQATSSWQKIFAVILDGDLKPGDIFCVCNFDLQQEMPPEELHTLLATLPPQSSVVKLRQYFPLEVELSLFVLKVGSEDDEKAKVSAPASLKQLQASREQTKRILSDQKPTFVKTFLAGLFGLLKDQRKIWRMLRSLLKIFISSVKIILFMVRDLAKWKLRLLRRLASSDRKEVFKETHSCFKNSFRAMGHTFNQIPKTSKYLILAALLIVVIIIFGVMAVSRSREASAKRATFEAAVTRIESLQSAAESAMIYKDETKARSLLKDALTSLEAIQTEDSNNLQRIKKIKNELTEIANGLKKITEIENPEVLIGLTAISEQPNITALFSANNKLYAAAGNGKIYTVNAADKTLEILSEHGAVSLPTTASAEGKIAAWLDETPALNLVNLETGTAATNIAAPSGERWVDLYVYGDRLYILAPGTGLASQVYRLSLTSSSVGTAVAWIKSPISELSDAVSLAVDGTVFVLRSNGKILRFVGGRDVAWSQGEVEPSLTSASDLWTSAESNRIYVLDPSGQRLLVYDKETGILKTQYHSSSFSGLTDFVVDETGKTIYLLGNETIWKITTD
jgi:DNA-binding beta-propeller fold protein YncE